MRHLSMPRLLCLFISFFRQGGTIGCTRREIHWIGCRAGTCMVSWRRVHPLRRLRPKLQR